MPLPLQPELACPIWAPSGNADLRLGAVERRDVEFAAERRLHHRDRHAADRDRRRRAGRRRCGLTGEKCRDRPADRRACPASPSPASRMRVPSSTPAGTLTESVRSRVTRPAPAHSAQGSSIDLRRGPWQGGQVRSMAKKPCCARTRPWPPQVVQARARSPASRRSRSRPRRRPRSAVDGRGLAGERLLERDLQIVAQVRAALAARAAGRRRPPPIMSPNRSSKMSDIEAAKSSLESAGRRLPFSKAAWPKRS